MKPFELRPALIIAAALLICACSSTRKAVEETSASRSADSLAITAAASASSVSSASFSSLLNTSRQLNLADIRVEFFPPDSSRPDGSPAVRSLSIGSADEDSHSSAAQSAPTDSAATVAQALDFRADSSSAAESTAVSDSVSHPYSLPSRLILLACLILGGFVGYRLAGRK